MVYKEISCTITPTQLRKAAAGKQIQLTKSQVGGSTHKFFVHPENHVKFMKAKKKGSGVRMYICDGAIHHDLAKTQGGSVWSWLKNAANSVYKFGKDNWNIIKPVVSKALDAGIPALATALGAPELAVPGRTLTKSLTGVGLKGSLERMARVRAAKKGGSFRLE